MVPLRLCTLVPRSREVELMKCLSIKRQDHSTWLRQPLLQHVPWVKVPYLKTAYLVLPVSTAATLILCGKDRRRRGNRARSFDAHHTNSLGLSENLHANQDSRRYGTTLLKQTSEKYTPCSTFHPTNRLELVRFRREGGCE